MKKLFCKESAVLPIISAIHLDLNIYLLSIRGDISVDICSICSGFFKGKNTHTHTSVWKRTLHLLMRIIPAIYLGILDEHCCLSMFLPKKPRTSSCNCDASKEIHAYQLVQCDFSVQAMEAIAEEAVHRWCNRYPFFPTNVILNQCVV